ncbi:MAG: dihydroorotase [Chloroflexi bacterium]|nr:dihydroorotase [Chloroflexota bacterium]
MRQGGTLLIADGRVIDPAQGIDRVADVFIQDGRIAWVGGPGAGSPPPEAQGAAVLRAHGLVVAPGFIDLHCHLREPGYEYKETIATGTLAAARGGFTTVCAMPNTTPPMDTAAVVDAVLRTARNEGAVKVFPIGCVTKGQRGEELAELGELAETGCVAFSDDGHPVADAAVMRHALEYTLALGRPIIDHCEDPALAHGAGMHEGVVSSRLGLRGMPAAAEEVMVARNLILAELTGARLHLAHVSTAGSVDLIRRAKARGLPVTAEATPHHLTLTDERVMGPGHGLVFPWRQPADPALLECYDTAAKVNPPLRTQADVEALIAGLRDGTIDAIATDHAPHATEDKLCEFDQAAMGISGIEVALGSVLALVHAGRMDLLTLVARLTVGPRRVLGERPYAGNGALPVPSAGTLAVGAPADVTIFDPNREWEVRPQDFASKGKNTPLAGCVLKGKVLATLVDGALVYRDPSLE